jgi:dipeptidyl aminopeptidase/acylaminoacyl peptidase
VVRFIRHAIAAGLALIAAPALGQAAPANRIPIEALATPPTASMARLSPDGTKIAALRTGPGSDFIYVFDVANPSKVVRKIEIGRYSLSDLVWANNDRLLLHPFWSISFLGISIGEAKLMVIDVGSGAMKQLDGSERGFKATDILYVEPAGGWALIAGLDKFDKSPSVMRVDLAAGTFVEVQKSLPDVWHWFVDGQGVIRGGLAHEGLKWALYLRTRPDEPLVKFRGKFDKKDVDVIEGVSFSPVGGETMVVSNHATGRFAAYRLDLATVEPGALVFENPRGDIDTLLMDPATYRVVGVRYHDQRWRTHWLDPDFARVQARVDKAFPTTDNQLADWSRDRNRFLIHASKPDDPGVYYVLDRAKGEMKIVLVPYGKIPEKGLSPVKYVQYQARDGLTVPAYLTVPVGEPERNLPLILFPHGGPFANDTWNYDPWVQFFASRGYAVFQPQFRGTTGFGRQYVERGYGEFGRGMQDDLDDGLDWLVRQGIVDPKRVCIAGGSYGGYAAMWGAIRNPERYRCAISWAGVTDLKGQLKHDRSLFSARRYYRDWRERVTGIDEKRADLEGLSPLRQAHRLRVPLLIGHGKRDKTVPVTQSEDLQKALGKGGIKVEAAFYDTQGHSISSPDDLANWLWRMEKFLAEHNPTDRLTAANVSAFPSKEAPAKGAPPETKAQD